MGQIAFTKPQILQTRCGVLFNCGVIRKVVDIIPCDIRNHNIRAIQFVLNPTFQRADKFIMEPWNMEVILYG